MDPPWENASARRGSKYPALPSRRLLAIPVPRLLHKANTPFLRALTISVQVSRG